MKDVFMVVGVDGGYEGGSTIVGGGGGKTLTLRLRREVANPMQEDTYASKIEQMLKVIDESKGTTDDDRKMARSMVSSLLETFMPKDQPFTLGAELGLTEEEYIALGRPTYGDRIALEAGLADSRFVAKGISSGSVVVVVGPTGPSTAAAAETSGPVRKGKGKHDWPASAKRFVDSGLSLARRGDAAKFLRENKVAPGNHWKLKTAVDEEERRRTAVHGSGGGGGGGGGGGRDLARPGEPMPPARVQLTVHEPARPCAREIDGTLMRFVAAFPPGAVPAEQKRCYKCVAIIDRGEELAKCPRCGGPLKLSRELRL